jgi:hypothetical protein
MQESLDASRGVGYFKEAAEFYGLGYTVASEDHLQLPAYKGPIGLTYARAG